MRLLSENGTIRCGNVLQMEVKREQHMLVLTLAWLFAVGVAVGAAVILDNFVQESATRAFALPSARV